MPRKPGGPVEPGDALLTDRVAVVTGAAVGIGRSIAESFAAFGARVAACDRDADNLATLNAALPGVLDVRDRDAVDGFMGEVRARFGRVDVLVNNAGGGFQSAFLDVSAKGQQALVDENFTSVTNFVRATAPLMTNGGSIINVTSIEAHRAAPGYAIYAAMKAAIANLTKSLSLELADRRIRVNCIAPDDIPTPGVGAITLVRSGLRPALTPPGTPEGPHPAAVGDTSLPDLGDVTDVAGAALFLAGDLSRFITGTTIHVDGGNIAAAGWRRQPDGSFRP